MHFAQSNNQEKIEQQDNHERQHECRRCSPADTLGAWRTIEASVAAHNRNCSAEKNAFEDSVEQIPVVDELLRVVPVMVRIDAKYVHAIQPTANDAHEN